MAIETRPNVNTFTANHAFVGLPFIEFAPETSTDTYGPFRQLGIVDSVELQKTVDLLTMKSFQSGSGSIVRELVGSLDLRLQVGLFQFDEQNLQLFLGSNVVTAVSAAPTAVLNDEFSVAPLFPNEFSDLSNRSLTTEPLTDLTCKAITGEAIGTADGTTSPETTGFFSLDFGVLTVAGSAITIYHDGVDVTTLGKTLVSGTTPTTNQIAIQQGAIAASGDITYATGEAPAAGVVITADYTPDHTFTNITDYNLDPTAGRIRMLATNKVKVGQKLLADYSYSRPAHNLIRPFTQRVFNGRCRVKQLTDVGINFVWNVPKVSVRLTDDAFAWASDDFARGTLIVNLLDNGGTEPFGDFQMHDETP